MTYQGEIETSNKLQNKYVFQTSYVNVINLFVVVTVPERTLVGEFAFKIVTVKEEEFLTLLEKR